MNLIQEREQARIRNDGAREDGRRQARKLVTSDKLLNPQGGISAGSIDAALLNYESKTIVISGTGSSGTATVSSGDVIFGVYISAVSGSPGSVGNIQASVSGTTLTVSLGAAPGAGTSVSVTVILMKA